MFSNNQHGAGWSSTCGSLEQVSLRSSTCKQAQHPPSLHRIHGQAQACCCLNGCLLTVRFPHLQQDRLLPVLLSDQSSSGFPDIQSSCLIEKPRFSLYFSIGDARPASLAKILLVTKPDKSCERLLSGQVDCSHLALFQRFSAELTVAYCAVPRSPRAGKRWADQSWVKARVLGV